MFSPVLDRKSFAAAIGEFFETVFAAYFVFEEG
jgi:hypothetical protein